MKHYEVLFVNLQLSAKLMNDMTLVKLLNFIPSRILTYQFDKS